MSIKRAIEKKIIECDGDEQIILSFYHSIKRAIDKELVSETKETDNNRLTHSMKRPQLMAAAFSRIISMMIVVIWVLGVWFVWQNGKTPFESSIWFLHAPPI